MDNGKNKKIRIYCPQDNFGFVSEKKDDIFCRSGNHFLSSEFPPKKDFWGYCGGCQRSFPLSLFEENGENLIHCVSCDREIADCYLCNFCHTILLDPKKNTLNKTHLVKNGDRVILTCPSCETVSGETVSLKPHDCEVLEASFQSARKICPICNLAVGDLENPASPEVVAAVEAEPAVFEEEPEPSAEISEPVVDHQSVETSEPAADLSSNFYSTVSAPSIEIEKPAQLEVKSRGGSAKTGCAIVFLVALMCASGVIFKVFFGGEPEKETADEVSVLENQNAPLSPASNTNAPSNKKTPVAPTKTKSFRSNSKVILDDASLRVDPDDYSEVVAILPLDTLIRVRDRKSLKSPWFKVKTENGQEGWIQGNFIEQPDWKSLPCNRDETGYISGGNLRSSPMHSVNEENILAVWEKGARVRIVEVVKGEAGAQTGNPFWYKVVVLSGSCSFDSRNAYLKDYSCDSETEGYMHSNLLDCE